MKKSVLKAFFALSVILYSIVSQAGPRYAVPKDGQLYMIPENGPVVLKVRISH